MVLIKCRQYLKNNARYIAVIFAALFDYMAVIFSEGFSYMVNSFLNKNFARDYIVPFEYEYIYIPCLVIAVLFLNGAYRRMRPSIDIYRDIVHALLLVDVAMIAGLFLFKVSDVVSRLYVLTFFLASLVTVVIFRTIALKIMKKHHAFYTPVMLLGAGLTAERTVRFFREDLGYFYEIVGVLDDAPKSRIIAERYPVLGGIDAGISLVKDMAVENVIITAPGMSKAKLADIIAGLKPYTHTVSFVPDLIDIPFGSVDAVTLFTEGILLVKSRNNLARRKNRLLKRGFDLLCVLGGGVIISPVLLLLVLLAAVDNHGRIIFAHKRVGKGGRPFYCYKFQTMVKDAEKVLQEYLQANPAAKKEWEASFKLTHDPRVTPLGQFLRRTSLDELPQLWNVLKGEMSLVGPRPIVKEEVPKYGSYIAEYNMVLPGITGMWQASGRSDTTYEERVAMDTWYVRNWSVWIDIMYLVKTFSAVIKAKGAY